MILLDLLVQVRREVTKQAGKVWGYCVLQDRKGMLTDEGLREFEHKQFAGNWWRNYIRKAYLLACANVYERANQNSTEQERLYGKREFLKYCKSPGLQGLEQQLLPSRRQATNRLSRTYWDSCYKQLLQRLQALMEQAYKQGENYSNALLGGNMHEFSITQPIRNVFCPTGEGGGVDPSCSPDTESLYVGLSTIRNDKYTYATSFHVGEKEFTFAARSDGTESSEWDVAFWPGTLQDGGSTRMTNDKGVSPVKVLRLVQGSLNNFITAKSPKVLIFTAANNEPSRVTFYDRVAKEIEKTYGYTPNKWSEGRKSGSTYYALVKGEPPEWVNQIEGKLSINEFNPDQPRDASGKWTDGIGVGIKHGLITRYEGFDEQVKKLGLPHLADRDTAAIAFSPEGCQTTLVAQNNALYFNTVSDSRGPDGIPYLAATRKVTKPWFAPLTCYNMTVEIKKDGPFAGKGFELLQGQVKALQKASVKRIVATAAGDPNDPDSGAGYYVWPRYGYSGTMSSKQIANLPKEIQTALKGRRDVRDLFDLPGGAEAWKKYGSAIKVHFDLTPGSRNLRAMEAYAAERKAKPVANYNPEQPRDEAGRWTESPDDPIEIYDQSTGEVFWRGTRQEGLALLKQQEEEVGYDPNLKLRREESGSREKEAVDREERIRKHEEDVKRRREAEDRKTGYGLLPGHPQYVNPPETLYHATLASDLIRREGIKTSDELGQQVLGGVASHLSSFTTKENAEYYRDALNLARRAARGELTDSEIIDAGEKYGVQREKVRGFLKQSNGKTNKSFEVLQRVSMEGRKFPLFMGTNWPEHLKSSQPADVVSLSARDVEEIYYNPGETEWRVKVRKGARLL